MFNSVSAKMVEMITPYVTAIRRIAWALVLFVCVKGCVYAYSAIEHRGEAKTQKLWDADKAQRNEALKKLNEKYAQLQNDHQKTVQKLTHDLSQANQDHAVALATARAEHSAQLRDSERRAYHYRLQAQAGSDSCGSLASHAARLDGSLTAGIELVEELRATLVLRDSQLKALGAQLMADRSLTGAP